jgi:trehalose 6-phosphate phosphatase
MYSYNFLAMLHDYSDKAFKAVILDMDGVITHTASTHARAWKKMFDAFLQRHALATGQEFWPLVIEKDYINYIDGIPRIDGIKNFLKSRGIELPEGAPGDAPDVDSMLKLSNQKNRIFLDLIESEGFDVIHSSIEQIRNWKLEGVKLGVASSSKNAGTILKAANLLPLFDAKIDGTDAEELHLKGKPSPDIFLETAKLLGVQPAQAVLVEDALLGVQAGRAGSFGLVAGLDPDGKNTEALLNNGADIVLESLKELKLTH